MVILLSTPSNSIFLAEGSLSIKSPSDTRLKSSLKSFICALKSQNCQLSPIQKRANTFSTLNWNITLHEMNQKILKMTFEYCVMSGEDLKHYIHNKKILLLWMEQLKLIFELKIIIIIKKYLISNFIFFFLLVLSSL